GLPVCLICAGYSNDAVALEYPELIIRRHSGNNVGLCPSDVEIIDERHRIELPVLGKIDAVWNERARRERQRANGDCPGANHGRHASGLIWNRRIRADVGECERVGRWRGEYGDWVVACDACHDHLLANLVVHWLR